MPSRAFELCARGRARIAHSGLGELVCVYYRSSSAIVQELLLILPASCQKKALAACLAFNASHPHPLGPNRRGSSGLPEQPYNPLEKRHLAEGVVRALLDRACGPLPPTEAFGGAGVYALYYHGDFAPYAPLTTANARGECNVPIYVGRARYPGARKGFEDDAADDRQSLFDRLSEHAESINAAANLKIAHFRCRYLMTDELWVALAERLLLEQYQPVWNVVIDGFGNHDPGAGRTNQKRSPWDVLHPGRHWAEKLAPGKQSPSELLAAIRAHLKVKAVAERPTRGYSSAPEGD